MLIIGEEEAIYSWAATNFIMGSLLPQSEGLGLVTYVNHTYGTLDLGGASAQIAYYVPSQDIMEGLYKFQLGGQKQWNVYTKSFLQFGVDSARQRHLSSLVDNFITDNLKINPKFNLKDSIKSITNPCFHAGYSETVMDSTKTNSYVLKGPELPQSDQFQSCMNTLRPLLEMQSNSFCEKVYYGDCSVGGAYQPPLPKGRYGNFIGTSKFMLPKSFLKIDTISTLDVWKEKGNMICQWNMDGLNFYYEVNSFSLNENHNEFQENLPYFCFLISYIVVLLQDGYHFPSDQKIMIIEEYNGNRVGWALGAILYEINELPFKIDDTLSKSYSWGLLLLVAFIGNSLYYKYA